MISDHFSEGLRPAAFWSITIVFRAGVVNIRVFGLSPGTCLENRFARVLEFARRTPMRSHQSFKRLQQIIWPDGSFVLARMSCNANIHTSRYDRCNRQINPRTHTTKTHSAIKAPLLIPI
jgi:hypothetical protein